ncbi:hypothetical protein ACFV1N_47425 [Streptosporangium canum]|uniref:hypothetical protein n=1 Tax=Streptosporangium canum TaxID=324952 RepID=UPI0036760A1F
MGRRRRIKTSSASTEVAPMSTESVRTSGDWLLVHGLPLTTPGIGAAVFAVLIALAHAKWSGDPVWTPLMSLLFLLIGGLITFFCWMSAGPRVLLRILMVVTGALATGNLVLGLIVGMQVIWPAYIICALVVWVLWVVWRGTKYAGATPTATGEGNALLEAIKNAKVQFHNPSVDERGVIRAKVITQPGGTLEGARNLLPQLSAEAQAVPGGTHLAGDPDRDGVGEIEIATRDNLGIPGGLPWPGVDRSAFGAPPTVPFAVGEYQTEPCMVCLVGDYDTDRDAEDVAHVKIGGVTGSGKGVLALGMLATLATRSRLNIIGVDVSKGMQTFGPVAAGLNWVITDMNEARRFFKRLRKVIKGRSDHLTREGLSRWSLRSSLNLLLIWVEESSDFAALAADYDHLLAKARSAGIMVVSSLQRITFRSMSTDARSNHTGGICFGVDSKEDAEYVLPEPALAALGQNLPTWGVTRRGYSYVAGLGAPLRKWARMQRAYNPTAEQLIATVDAGAPFRDPMDQVTVGLFGELYQQRTYYTGPVWGPYTTEPAPKPRPMPPAGTTPTAATQPPAVPAMRPAPPSREGAALTAEEQTMEDQARAEIDEERQEMQRQLDESRRRDLGEDARPQDLADVDPHDVITGVAIPPEGDGDAPSDDVRPKPSPEEAQRMWDLRLDAWYREGRDTVFTKDLVALLGEVQRDRRFLYRQRDRWLEVGCLADRPDAEGWDLIASPLEIAGSQ